MDKDTILCLIVSIYMFLYVGRTTINKVWPYIHIEYPVRAAVITCFLLLIVWIAGLIANWIVSVIKC